MAQLYRLNMGPHYYIGATSTTVEQRYTEGKYTSSVTGHQDCDVTAEVLLSGTADQVFSAEAEVLKELRDDPFCLNTRGGGGGLRGKPVACENVSTGEVLRFMTTSEAAAFLGCSTSSVSDMREDLCCINGYRVLGSSRKPIGQQADDPAEATLPDGTVIQVNNQSHLAEVLGLPSYAASRLWTGARKSYRGITLNKRK